MVLTDCSKQLVWMHQLLTLGKYLCNLMIIM
jgi:hypothetical protein